MKRRAHRDPVTPELRDAVLARDGWRCVAPSLGARDLCRTAFGDPMEYAGEYRVAHLELDHVKDQPRMGVRAESDLGHLVALCPWHHRESGWATSHRGELREYLALKAPAISTPEAASASEASGSVPPLFPRKGVHL